MEHQDKVASIVHSAKNQLQLLQPAVQNLAAHTDSEVRQTGEEISKRLSEVNQQLVLMLSLYRLEETELLSVEPLLVDDLFATAIDLAGDSRVINMPVDDELEVYGDQRLIQAVVGDAIHNGLRHCRSQVVLTAEVKHKGVLIRVLDDGDQETEKLPTGSGVGLWVANKIAGAHRNGDCVGYAKHEFETDGGSCFELFIP